ncbi:hypothetical protein Tco_0812510 [Tanacetum coccineum]
MVSMTRFLELLHMDLFVPSVIRSYGGNRYTLVIVDDYSRILKICEETNLVLNWEKGHFMIKEGIVLGHKVSRSGIEVDRAKIKSIFNFPNPINVKVIRRFLGHAGFYHWFIKDFSKIAHPMTQLLVEDALFVFSEECICTFDKLKQELTQAPIMVKPDWSLPF